MGAAGAGSTSSNEATAAAVSASRSCSGAGEGITLVSEVPTTVVASAGFETVVASGSAITVVSVASETTVVASAGSEAVVASGETTAVSSAGRSFVTTASLVSSTGSTAAPHDVQNFAPGLSSLPQLVQNMDTSPLVLSWLHDTTRIPSPALRNTREKTRPRTAQPGQKRRDVPKSPRHL